MLNVSKSNIRFTTLALLVAIELLLGFTPLGFIAIPPVSITTMHIPVIISSIILGPLFGSVIGLTFGLVSLFSAITSAALSPVSLLFSPFASGAPLYSIIMCIVPRVLLGIIPAYVYKLLSNFIKVRTISIGISAAIATVCHTIMVLGCMSAFFKALVLKEVFLTIISLNGTVEILAAVIVVPAVALPVRKYIISRGTLITS
ncbi:MAG: ECF transporter S component [Cellulosilyticum sp.]|nr:ECF transporter S component [Cellulosilyticum sp.]